MTKPKSKTATKKNHIIECARNEDCKKMKCPGGAKICTGVPLCNGGFCDLYQRSKLKCKIKCPKNKTSPKTHHRCTFKWIDKLDTCHADSCCTITSQCEGGFCALYVLKGYKEKCIPSDSGELSLGK